jgi:hypothetical protein
MCTIEIPGVDIVVWEEANDKRDKVTRKKGDNNILSLLFF